MPKFDAASLKNRLASGFVLGPIVLAIIYFGSWPFLGLTGLLTIIAAHEWLKLSGNLPHKHLSAVLGVIYVGFGFYCTFLLRDIHGALAAFAFIGMIWMSDSGAYFTGKLIGGPKLAQGISPNKTWAGFAGAFLCPGVFLVLWLIISPFIFQTRSVPQEILLHGFTAGSLIGITGQAGDLLMSWFKRAAKIKDTGTIIPGHGGLLDRVDSMLLAAPLFLYLISTFPLLNGYAF